MDKKIVDAALQTLKQARKAVESVSQEFKLWRRANPNDPIERGRGKFLADELKECRAREDSNLKTLNLLINAKTFSNAKRRADDFESDLVVEPARKKMKSVAVEVALDATPQDHIAPALTVNETGSIATATAVQESGASSSSDSDSSSSSSDSDSDSSDSSSSSSSDSDSSDSDSESEPEKKVAKPPFHVITAPVKIPSNLSKSKLKAVRGMIDIPALHKHFNDDEEQEGVQDDAAMKPRVKYTEVRLYNPKSVFKATKSNGDNGGRKRVRKGPEKEDPEPAAFEEDGDVVAEIDQDADEPEKDQHVEVDYSSFPSYSEKRPPAEGSAIAFKQLELSQAYTPELSDWKRASISKIDIDFDGSKTKFMVSLALDTNSNMPVEPKIGWGPKINQLPYGNQTAGKFDIADEEEHFDDHEVIVDTVIVADWSTLIEVKLIR